MVLDFFLFFIEASEELEELWKDFNENGVDVGPYEEDEESPLINKVRRKSKTCISDLVSSFRFVVFKNNLLHCLSQKKVTHCSFCKNNGRDESIYKTHTKTSCQILKKYKCPVCFVKGHTRRYCPKKPIIEG